MSQQNDQSSDLDQIVDTERDLGLDLIETIAIGSARGRKSAPLELEFCRKIVPEDLPALENPAPQGSTTPLVVRLRHTHHMLARLLAEGHKQAEASLITGYSPSRISLLQKDPAFAELVAYYKTQVEAKYLDVHERLAALGFASLEELQERLETDPDALSNRELMELAEFCLDRSVTAGAKPQPNGGVQIAINFVRPKEQDPGQVIDLSPDAA